MSLKGDDLDELGGHVLPEDDLERLGEAVRAPGPHRRAAALGLEDRAGEVDARDLERLALALGRRLALRLPLEREDVDLVLAGELLARDRQADPVTDLVVAPGDDLPDARVSRGELPAVGLSDLDVRPVDALLALLGPADREEEG